MLTNDAITGALEAGLIEVDDAGLADRSPVCQAPDSSEQQEIKPGLPRASESWCKDPAGEKAVWKI